MSHAVRALIAAAMIAVARPISAQTSPAGSQREIGILVGAASVSHGDDRLGTGLTAGGWGTVPVARRLAVRLEVHQTLGPEPSVRTCAVTVPCSGVGHEGLRRLTIWNGSVAYFLGSARVKPYGLIGWDVFQSTTVSAVTIVRDRQATISEIEGRSTTMGLTVGGGARVPVTDRLSLAPELRVFDGSVLGGANLSQVRVSLGVGFAW